MKPIEFQVLSLLQEKKSGLTGYAIQKTLEERFQGLWKPSLGTIFPVLRRLEEDKCFITSETIESGNRKAQKYTITEDGQAALQQTLVDSDQELDFISEYLGRLFRRGGRMWLPKVAEFIAQLLEGYDVGPECDPAECHGSPPPEIDPELAEHYRGVYERIKNRFQNFDPAVVFPPFPPRPPPPERPPPKPRPVKSRKIEVEGSDNEEE